MIQLLQYFNVIHLIQSTILSSELSLECLQLIELITKTLSTELRKLYFYCKYLEL